MPLNHSRINVYTTLLFMSLPWSSSFAAEFMVTSNADSGPGSLRAAIAQANSTLELDEISFADGLGPILLETGSIAISAPLIVTGNVVRQVISGNNQSRIFSVTTTAESVTLQNLDIQNGHAQGEYSEECLAASGNGGAICAASNLEIENSRFQANVSEDRGGAISVIDRNLSITGSLLSHNQTTGDVAAGGALSFDQPIASNFNPELRIQQSSFENNATLGDDSPGGAIYVGPLPESLIIEGSSFLNNQTSGSGSLGGAIYSWGSTSLVNVRVEGNSTSLGPGGGHHAINGSHSIRNSTFSDNTAGSESGHGGAVSYRLASSVDIYNSTFSGNLAHGRGGGIYADTVNNLRVYNSTISENRQSLSGGGAAFYVFTFSTIPATFRSSFYSTILSGSINNSSWGEFSSLGPTNEISMFHTLVDDDSNLFEGADNVISSEPGLSDLGNYGCAQPAGFPETASCVLTHLPLLDSLSINGGSNPLELPFDQRGAGFPRSFPSGTTIGATSAPSKSSDFIFFDRLEAL